MNRSSVGNARDKWRLSNLIWLPIIAFAAWTDIPVIWSILASLKGTSDVFSFSFLPESPSLRAYGRVISLDGFERYVMNSVLLATVSTIVAVLVSAVAAYAFSRYAFRFRHALLLLILLPRLVPRVSLIVPLYQMLNAIGWLDTYQALLITYAASSVPLGAWILTGFFKALPRDYEDAAAVDGANTWQQLWRIMVPLSLPGLITVAVLSFRDAWNEFPFALAFTSSSEMRTLPYALYVLEDSFGVSDWPAINAFALLTILPIVVLYLLFEKRVVAGMTSGGLK